MPVQFSNFVTKPPLIGAEWPPAGDWSANNNGIADWQKCCTKTDIPPHPVFGNPSLTTLTAQQPGEKPHGPTEYTSPKEDGRKSSEHTNSYDVSASQSPSNTSARSDGTSEEPVDVECVSQVEDMDTDDKDRTMQAEPEEGTKTPTPMMTGSVVSAEPTVSSMLSSLPAPIAISPEKSGLSAEATNLLLSISRQEFSDIMTQAKDQTMKIDSDLLGFMRSGSSAFSNIEPKEVSTSASTNNEEAPAPTASATVPSTPSSASFCRPPGLGPVAHPPQQNGQTPMLVCPICGFMCPSKFHFNSHMNTHGDHQCSMCDYTSRTEGRLKKHMRESHTVEEQLRAGLELEPVKEQNGNVSSPKGSSSSSSIKEGSVGSPPIETFNLSTTMASLLNSTNSAIAASSTIEQPSALAALTMDISSTPTLLSSLTQSNFSSSALDQIKAISENPNFLPDTGLNLASALGAVSQAIKCEPASPEKQSNGETRRSSSGKVKIFKCKQCGHQSCSKDEQWAHARTHIPAEKQLNCQHCNFVTEYKHHLEYHYRNHIGSKPFECKKCSYSCVNKSMLNSHMKSHTNHYQFRCMDCTYATKYCHSLKLHLKKYNHRRVPEGIDMNGETSPTLNSEGSMTFSPSLVKQEIKQEQSEPVTPIAQPFAFNPMMASQGFSFANQILLHKNPVGLMGLSGLRSAPMPTMKCAICDFVATSPEENMRHSMSHILSSGNIPTSLASLYSTLNLPTLAHFKPPVEAEDNTTQMDCDTKMEDDTTESNCGEEEMDQSSDLAISPAGSSQASLEEDSKRTKAALSIDQLSAQTLGHASPMSNDSAVERDGESADDSQPSPTDSASVPSPSRIQVPIAAPIAIGPHTNTDFFQSLFQHAQMALVSCQHCKISLGNQANYLKHMANHSVEDPFKCANCSFRCNDSLSFALHLFQANH